MDIAYPILKQLLLPPGILLILFALAFLLVRGTLGRLVLFVGWSLLAMLSIPALALPLIRAVEPYPALPPTGLAAVVAASGAQAIVVLGGDTYTDAPEYGAHSVGVRSLERARYAAWLQRATGLPLYISGGRGERAPGRPMRAVLTEEFGVPVAALESESRTTWENARYTAPLLAAAGIDRVLLVTQAWHMPRAVAAFKRFGIRVTPAPTGFIHHRSDAAPDRAALADWLPQSNQFANSAFAVHELLGQVLYDLRARLERPAPGRAAAPPPAPLPHPDPPG